MFTSSTSLLFFFFISSNIFISFRWVDLMAKICNNYRSGSILLIVIRNENASHYESLKKFVNWFFIEMVQSIDYTFFFVMFIHNLFKNEEKKLFLVFGFSFFLLEYLFRLSVCFRIIPESYKQTNCMLFVVIHLYISVCSVYVLKNF